MAASKWRRRQHRASALAKAHAVALALAVAGHDDCGGDGGPGEEQAVGAALRSGSTGGSTGGAAVCARVGSTRRSRPACRPPVSPSSRKVRSLPSPSRTGRLPPQLRHRAADGGRFEHKRRLAYSQGCSWQEHRHLPPAAASQPAALTWPPAGSPRPAAPRSSACRWPAGRRAAGCTRPPCGAQPSAHAWVGAARRQAGMRGQAAAQGLGAQPGLHRTHPCQPRPHTAPT